MGRYNFKDTYPQINESINPIIWLSAIGDKNIALTATTRFTPKSSQGLLGNIPTGNGNTIPTYGIVLSSGIHAGSMAFQQAGANQPGYNVMCGQGMRETFFKKTFTQPGGDARFINNLTVYDMTFEPFVGNRGYSMQYMRRCDLLSTIGEYANVLNCKVRSDIGNAGSRTLGALSFIGITAQNIQYSGVQNTLFDSCNVVIGSQADVNRSTTIYNAFNACTFKIGTETTYTALTGGTEAALRQNFADRCAAQGYTVPTITEYGDTNLLAGRWVFSNSSAIDGLVLKGSTIHAFEQSRLIYFGYSDSRGDSIPITADNTTAGAFNPNGANATLAVTDGSIAFQSNVDISQPNTGISDSNIIWLGGKKQLNDLRFIHNFPMQYGVMIDGTPTLSVPVTTIMPYDNGDSRTYLVRSTDDNEATVTYNGVTYSSVLLSLNNVFRGVAGQTAFTGSQNAVVYEILDEVMFQTIQMRIVNKIPADIITTGNLQAGYWYFVEPDSSGDTTGTVTYNGVTYPAYSSFLAASGALGFSITGATHLRRCWRQDYNNPADEITDQAFWANEQKPKWFDVLPDDLRCLMKNNNGLEAEIQTDTNGNYIASGHPDFYNSLLGVNGIALPAYFIKGTYMQLRVTITTLNPM